MRSLFLAVIVLAGVTAASAATTPSAQKPAAAAPKPAPAAPLVKLTPDDIQKTFFTGQPFTSATPSGVSFKMTFTADGKMKREPVGKGGSKGEGAWALDKTGFCTTWKGAKANCFTVVSNDKKWSVMRGSAIIAVWTK